MNVLDFFPETSNSDALDILSLYVTPVVAFCDSMHGKSPLEHGVMEVAKCVDACAAMYSRTRNPGEPAQLAAVFDTANFALVPRLNRSYIREVVGESIDLVGIGSAVFLSNSETSRWDCDPTLSRWMEKRSVRDVAIIRLSSSKRNIDVIELHFSEVLSGSRKQSLTALAEYLARVYATRRPGLVAEALARSNTTPRQSHDFEKTAILSPENPAGLTRAEFRICALIGRGLAAKTIANELAVSITTVRTHLRRIYSKTGYTSYYELSHRLVSLNERLRVHFETRQSA